MPAFAEPFRALQALKALQRNWQGSQMYGRTFSGKMYKILGIHENSWQTQICDGKFLEFLN